MIKKIFTLFIISILSFSVVSARTVEYDFYDNTFLIKDILQWWVILTDNDIDFKEFGYVINTNFNWDTIIPKYTSLEKKIIDRFWYEDINELIKNRYIFIWWSKYRFSVSNKPYLYWPIKVEDKKELNTNMEHRKLIKINSPINQNVTLKLYSVSPEYFTWEFSKESAYMVFDSNIINDDKKILTFYDTTQEFYNVSWRIESNKFPLWDLNKVSEEYKLKEHENADLKIEKKYELIKFKRKIPNWEYWISKSYIPYHEISFDVSKWANDLYLNYESYQFPNEPLQIK